MAGVGTTLCGTGRASRSAAVAAALSFALLPVTAWGAATSGTRASVRPTGCSSPGQVYRANILVKHDDDTSEVKALFLVCDPDRFVKIVDPDGRSYDDLDDFRAHNHLFTEDDKIMVPRSFPAVDAKESPGFGPWVSGHTGTSQARRWLPAGTVLLLVLSIGGGLAWLVTRKRHAPNVRDGVMSTGVSGDGTSDVGASEGGVP